MDMAPSTDILNGFGQLFRTFFQQVLGDVLLIRGIKDAKIDVQGLDFDSADDLGDVELTQALLDMEIPSPTLTALLRKRLARRFLRNADPETTLKKIDKEIDNAPTPEQIQANALTSQIDVFRGKVPNDIGPAGGI
jgi:hypothetical protein